MKFALKAFTNRFALATVMMLLATSESYAQISNANMGTIFRDAKFQTAVTLGFGLFAFYKWVEFFSGFQLSSALREIILPAILTFLTFQWNKVLQWFGFL